MSQIEHEIMLIFLRNASQEELTCVVVCYFKDKKLYAEVSDEGCLSFREDGARLFTESYAKWLVDKLNTIRDEKGLTEKDIRFDAQSA